MATPVFRVDDYAETQRAFRRLRLTDGIDADPSGWRSTLSESEPLMPEVHLSTGDLSQYRVDAPLGLGSHKPQLLALLSSWEDRIVSDDEVSLCPNGTLASLAVLAVLKSMGVDGIRFETPAYFASLDQARRLDIPTRPIATFRSNAFATPFDNLLNGNEKLDPQEAVWLTQPRAGLGFNQPVETVGRFVDALEARRQFAVIDEVTDQLFPAHLAGLSQRRPRSNLIRVRSFTKGIGLNGIRLAAILHPPALRSNFIDTLDRLGGSIDAYSLAAVSELGRDLGRFRRMLETANQQSRTLCARLALLTRGSSLHVNPLQNGYIGSMVADLGSLGKTQEERRQRLLAECLLARTPVVLGSSYCMAADPPTELIRLNLFIPADSVIRGVRNLLGILRRPTELP